MASRLVIVTFVLAALAGPLRAGAALADETPTPVSHLVPYNLDWIAYIDPADAPPVRYAVCIVDTGVNITPDTPPDDPVNGPILKRIATDGGPGTQQGGTDPALLHGTRMAFASIAPKNDWGTVGVWPFGTAISVRATVNNESSLRPSAYLFGLSECTSNAYRFPVAATLWALGCPTCTYTAEQRRLAEESVRQARAAGMAVIAATANTSGAVTGPASLDGVFVASSGAPTHLPCQQGAPFSAVLMAPGCPVDSADPLTGTPMSFSDGGSSSAAAEVAAFFALLRSYRPGASSDQIVHWIQSSATNTNAGLALDGESAARAAGLGGLVNRALGRKGADSPVVAPAAPPQVAPAPTAVSRDPITSGIAVPIPAFVAYQRQHLTIRLAEWAAVYRLEVRFDAAMRRGLRFAKTSRVRVKRRRAPRAILMRFISTAAPHQRSQWIRLVRAVDSPRYLLG